jgi:membrane protease YdiL (CAAX protease family)
VRRRRLFDWWKQVSTTRVVQHVDAAPGDAQVEVSLPQYSRGQVILVWGAAAAPMALLGWVANPLVAGPIDQAAGIPGTARILLMTLGLVWQFVLVLLLLRVEAGSLSWPVLRDRLWLRAPRHPRTGQPGRRLWLWLVPLVLLYPLTTFTVSPVLNDIWLAWFPYLAEPPEFSLSRLLDEPVNRELLVGAWWFYALFLLLALFNTVLGEEFLFRGLLLPRMQGAFGRVDWLANGTLFGLYHLHQPWGIPGGILVGTLFFALPTRIFRSAWMGIIVHSGQSLFFAIVVLQLILGRA